ncbi:hypothetical protein [Mucilaginibacter aquaedulcis]|uniref:hypothetical protein n=1 Tax=Mucilaginibacter aquaedulcis TaxID=1187081 RepID=UPI0025B52934|nr:hypothetical protein [Mucilaginibacter aquaedulcis]MDN3547288.1 hypothetical protein [Mucilaginibacter aquaedulcis]
MKKLTAIILLLVMVCKSTLANAQSNEFTKIYNAATKLAMVADSTRNIDTLMTLTATNPVLQWKTIHGKNYVLMATFMNNIQVNNVFRPAGSPDVTVPSASGTLSTNVSLEYKLWFNNYVITSYFQPLTSTGVYYPWTRMGYAYNWAPGANRVGVSEFVLNPDSGIWVEAVYKASDYFRN